jgi:hypothetical protein
MAGAGSLGGGCGPSPPPSPVSEDDLVYPEDDTKALCHLFARLGQYLDSRPTSIVTAIRGLPDQSVRPVIAKIARAGDPAH